MVRQLPQVTLFGLDCVDVDRLLHAATICTRSFEFGGIRLLTSLPVRDSRMTPIDPVRSIAEYNHFMIKQLSTWIDTPFAMVIQHDGFILNPDAWSDAFLDFDYIGAPWWVENRAVVGNGGFSIRSRKLLSLLSTDPSVPSPGDEPEDWFISVTVRKELERKGIAFAPPELAARFAFEANEHDGIEWNGQLGFHGLKWTDISRWTKDHPEDAIDNTLDSWATRLRNASRERGNP